MSLQGAAGALLSFGCAGQSWQAPAACAAQSGPGWPAAHPAGQDGCLCWPCRWPRSYTCKAGAGIALMHISMAENAMLKVKVCLPGLQGTGMWQRPGRHTLALHAAFMRPTSQTGIVQERIVIHSVVCTPWASSPASKLLCLYRARLACERVHRSSRALRACWPALLPWGQGQGTAGRGLLRIAWKLRSRSGPVSGWSQSRTRSRRGMPYLLAMLVRSGGSFAYLQSCLDCKQDPQSDIRD